MDAIRFRRGNPRDAAAIGALHAASWRETYAGLLPAALVDGPPAEARTAMWRAVLVDPAAHGGVAVFVAESGRDMVGFGACGAQRDPVLEAQGYDGEFGAIYILRSHQRAALGRALMSLMAEHLHAEGRAAASLWVLNGNVPARAFYERLSGVAVGEKSEAHAGTMLAEVAYGWRDLRCLIR